MAQNEQQLKQKYQPAINLMQQLQVNLKHIHMQGEKLFIQGEAPSQEVKNKVWDQIKLIDSGYPDLVCDLAVNATAAQAQSPAPAVQAAGAAMGGGQSARRYTVRPGDSLSKISKQFYGNPGEYMKIFEANRNILSDPNKIQPGQELTIPE